MYEEDLDSINNLDEEYADNNIVYEITHRYNIT